MEVSLFSFYIWLYSSDISNSTKQHCSLLLLTVGTRTAKDLSTALQTYSLKAKVYSPSAEAKATPLQASFPLHSVVLAPQSVCFHPFEPASHKIADSWVDVFGLPLFELRLGVSLTPSEPESVGGGESGDQRKDFVDVFADVVLVFDGELFPKVLLVEGRL